MEFRKLPANAEKLLREILQAENPTKMLCEKFEGISHQEYEILRAILRQLREEGYINIKWASNVPYRVIVNNPARAYDEQLGECEKNKYLQQATKYVDQSINIGDGNTIIGSEIGNGKINTLENRKTFYERHPVMCGFLISLVAGIVLLFSFWEKIINLLEGIF